MVWCLAANDSKDPGPFYFTAAGTYTVGRKDCTITIQTDKTISRIHAEITVEPAPLLGPAEKDFADLPRCKVLLKDHSKFGTFVNKAPGTKPLNSLPDNIAVLKDGDVITFGTNKAVFKLQHLPIILCMSPSALQSSNELRTKVETVGAYIFEQWNTQCTHLLVEEASSVTDLVIQAVVNKRPVLTLEWLQAFVIQSSPTNQLPSLSRYIPTLMINCQGRTLPASVAEPQAREETLHGYTIFMEKGTLYHHLDLPMLVNTAGGAVNFFTRNDLEGVIGSKQKHGLLLLPAGKLSRKDWLGGKTFPLIEHLHPLSEETLLQSILTAKLDLAPAALSPAASVDTDETVKEDDSEVEDPVLVMLRTIGRGSQNVLCCKDQNPMPEFSYSNVEGHWTRFYWYDIFKKTVEMCEPNPILQAPSVWQPQPVESGRGFEKTNLRSSPNSFYRKVGQSLAEVDIKSIKSDYLRNPGQSIEPRLKSENAVVTNDEDKGEVIFSSGLLVRSECNPSLAEASFGVIPNFKRFKKGLTSHGNSFNSLVPFAKEPYRESDYGKELGDYIKQEKMRKDAERVAEDLFNAEQLKRKRVTVAETGTSTSRSRKL